MAGSRKLLTVGALGVASFALIGAGATATFNDSVTARQNITTGVMNMSISSPEDGATRTSDHRTLTLKALGPVGSSFTTGPQRITVKNNSAIEVMTVTLKVTAPTDNDALRDGLYVKIDMNGAPVYNDLLTSLQKDAASPLTSLTIRAGGSVSADVTFYAGKDTNTVAFSKDRAAGLPNDAQGNWVKPTFTVGLEG